MCYKFINGLVAIDCPEFFSFTDCDRTRGHNIKLYIQNCRLDVRKFSFARSPEALVKVFCTYVRPILEYCTPVWSPHHIGLVDKIEKVQRRFTKRIFYMSNLSYLKIVYCC